MAHVRNIGISAHIDSGKTTLTERVLFYTGRIHEIHEVKGRDGVGAKMDSMELEREKGITIQSAATHCTWGNTQASPLFAQDGLHYLMCSSQLHWCTCLHINIIDTPGHVDFTIEVERALRVLDGAVLVLCSVGGVQSQSITVDRQMRRYGVPRLAFINKLDRTGADPWKVVDQVRKKLRLNCAAVQYPIGLESNLEGLIDLVHQKAIYFHGAHGEKTEETEVPGHLMEKVLAKRKELIEAVSEVDDTLAEKFLMEEPIQPEELQDAVRRATLSLKFIPVYMGRGAITLRWCGGLLPCPTEVSNHALDQNNVEEKVYLTGSPEGPMVGLAFKLEEGKFGQLTYLRMYEGTMKRGSFVVNSSTGRKIKVPRLVRMHADDMEVINHLKLAVPTQFVVNDKYDQDIQEARAGEIVAMFGVDCATGDTFTDGSVNFTMTSMNVPDPVMSLAISPASKDISPQFSKALNRFQREDPTFRVGLDPDSGQTIISGMGELHLDIYVERMRREYKVDTIVGKPQVNFRETLTQRAEFDYLHKKQSGGQGQYGRVCGFIEPLEEGPGKKFVFENQMIGQAIPSSFIPAIEKGFLEAANRYCHPPALEAVNKGAHCMCPKAADQMSNYVPASMQHWLTVAFDEPLSSGSLIGFPVEGARCVLTDGASHAVDSSELAFKLAALYAFRQCYMAARPVILEPIMSVEIKAPVEFQGAIVGNVNRRKGLVVGSDQDGDDVTVIAHVPLNNMFGYSTDLRSMTQGKGEFTMEYLQHGAVPQDVQAQLIADLKKGKS
eukprot:SM000008S22379  [mRNA]  locus=s8:1421279:1428064:+ [translate_table: standard]